MNESGYISKVPARAPKHSLAWMCDAYGIRVFAPVTKQKIARAVEAYRDMLRNNRQNASKQKRRK